MAERNKRNTTTTTAATNAKPGETSYIQITGDLYGMTKDELVALIDETVEKKFKERDSHSSDDHDAIVIQFDQVTKEEVDNIKDVLEHFVRIFGKPFRFDSHNALHGVIYPTHPEEEMVDLPLTREQRDEFLAKLDRCS